MQALDTGKVIIYGTGGNGLSLARMLRNESIQVKYFIDKRADEIVSIEDIPVKNLSELDDIDDKEQYIVFITIKNVFAHSEIASDILKRGYTHIIYKPSSVLRGYSNNTDEKVNELYELLIERKQYKSLLNIPATKNILIKFRNRLIISDDEDTIKVWCPVELIFNYKSSNDYPGLNMPLFFPLVELYRFLLGQEGEYHKNAIENFIVYCSEWLRINNKELDDSQLNSFLESRISVFQEMQKMTEIDNDFFKSNCPLVEYENEKFYISSSGRNRVSFLIAKGYKYVPVRMNRLDYEKWCNLKRVLEIEDKVNVQRIGSFFAPEPNPYLVDYKIDFVDYQRLILWPIANEIIKEIYIKSRYNKGTLTCTDFDKVEVLKKKYIITCDIEDGGISNAYFESIGLGRTNVNAEYIYNISFSEDKEIKRDAKLIKAIWIKNKKKYFYFEKIVKE